MTPVRREKAERLADEELMPWIAKKDPEAFEVFYDRHGGAGYSLAYRILGDRSAAEDCIQEAFISIWRSGARFDRTRGSVRSWTLSIVRNRAIDSAPQQGRQSAETDLRRRRDPRVAGRRASTPKPKSLRHETAGEVRGALSQLPGEQSKVIELAYFGGFSQSEIAGMLNVPLGTVKGRMRLGLEKIRAELAEGMA